MVPCRGGSKGIHQKNIALFNGMPLLYWNIKALLDYGKADVYLNTDDEEIEAVAYDHFGNDINYFDRSIRTARDEATTIEVVQEFIEKVNLENNDILILTQVTSPYLTADDVGIFVRCLLSAHYDSYQSVGRVYKFFYDDFGKCINYDGAHKRRQDWEGTLQRNGCLYVTTAGMIRKTASYTGGNLGQILQPHAWEIDEYADIVYGEAKLNGFGS